MRIELSTLNPIVQSRIREVVSEYTTSSPTYLMRLGPLLNVFGIVEDHTELEGNGLKSDVQISLPEPAIDAILALLPPLPVSATVVA